MDWLTPSFTFVLILVLLMFQCSSSRHHALLRTLALSTGGDSAPCSENRKDGPGDGRRTDAEEMNGRIFLFRE